ncbi:MAG: F0F1 ATP synthase subunit epsilon [Planctomycetota bacterium]
MADMLHCTVVTPEGEVLDDAFAYVDLPLSDGRMGFAPKRAPIVAELGAGKMRAKSASGEQVLAIAGGFVQMDGQSMTVLTEYAASKADLSRQDADQALADAQALPTDSQEQKAERQRKIDRARACVSLFA